MSNTPKIAVIGSGVTGLGAAHALKGAAQITLFEADSRFGGHANTVDVTLPTASGLQTQGIDTGFLVYNERTYPLLIDLFKNLEVDTAPSEMSFSVQTFFKNKRLEWAGTDLNGLFAQRGNLLSPSFYKMLLDLLRLNHLCTEIARRGDEVRLKQPLQTFLDEHRFSQELREGYLLPMLGCIWSCPTQQMLQFPVETMIRFCHNHGLMQITNRPQWRTVRGGSRHYVQKITDQIADKRLNCPVISIQRIGQQVEVRTASSCERFNKVIIATHAPQALQMLGDASQEERDILSAFRTQANLAILHTDERVLPRSKHAWSAWNYVRGNPSQEQARVCLHYLINKLQPIALEQSVIVSLNPSQPIAPEKIITQINYAHPVMDMAAIAAQARLKEINGVRNTWFCGAWTRYGFHEDGLMSGVAAAQAALLGGQA